jgi:phosphatidylinositol-3-phosphatase
MRRMRSLLLAGLVALMVGCGGGTPKGTGAGGSAGHTSASPSASKTSTPSRPVTKVLVVIEENHSLDQMRAGMPYTYSLAERFGYAENYFALAHPSLPNYLAIVAGSTFGISDDHPPAAHPIAASSVFADALARGRTAGVYADGMPQSCAASNGGDHYAVRHNPWTYFTRERSVCKKFDVPGTRLRGDIEAGRLPSIGLVIPNTCHDAHDCGLQVADAWFANVMRQVFAGPDWRAGHLAVVLTADEDDRNEDNNVLTVVVHPSQHHHLVEQRLDHRSLFQMLEEVVGAPGRPKTAGRTTMLGSFGLPVTGGSAPR